MSLCTAAAVATTTVTAAELLSLRRGARKKSLLYLRDNSPPLNFED